MADRWVALLRGVNVGGANRVAMADLRALVTGLGYGEVSTVLNSGNVVFTAGDGAPPEPGARIAEALAATLGVSARVTALSSSEVAEAVAGNTLVPLADDPSRLLFAFPAVRSDLSLLDGVERQDWAPEACAVGTRAAYLWCPNGVSDSRLWKAVGAALGDGVTSRNWATVLKLQAVVEGRA
jgi:uncharacterized protein (DUF1697 family)